MSWETWAVTAFNGVLIFILGLILKPVISYITKLIEEVKDFKKKIKDLEKEIKDGQKENSEAIKNSLAQIYKLEGHIWDKLGEMRRSVTLSSIVIRKRKSETNKILNDTAQTMNDIKQLKSVANTSLKIMKKQNLKIKDIDQEIIKINNDIVLIKSKNSSNGAKQ